MNPLDAMKVLPLLNRFNENHPKIKPFMQAASGMIEEGSIIEINVTNAEGRNIVTNFRITEDDIQLFAELKNLGK